MQVEEYFVFLIAYLWGLGGHWIVNVLKIVIDDHRCNSHPNSISGHAMMFVYANLGCLGLYAFNLEAAQRTERNKTDPIFWLGWFCLLFTSIFTIADTYVHGFHTARQMFYGALVGLFLYLVMVEILDLIQNPNNNDLSAIQSLILNLFPDDDSHLTTKKFLYPTTVVLSWNLFAFSLTVICYMIGAEKRYFRYLCGCGELIICAVCWGVFALLHDHEDKITQFLGRCKRVKDKGD